MSKNEWFITQLELLKSYLSSPNNSEKDCPFKFEKAISQCTFYFQNITDSYTVTICNDKYGKLDLKPLDKMIIAAKKEHKRVIKINAPKISDNEYFKALALYYGGNVGIEKKLAFGGLNEERIETLNKVLLWIEKEKFDYDFEISFAAKIGYYQGFTCTFYAKDIYAVLKERNLEISDFETLKTFLYEYEKETKGGASGLIEILESEQNSRQKYINSIKLTKTGKQKANVSYNDSMICHNYEKAIMKLYEKVQAIKKLEGM